MMMSLMSLGLFLETFRLGRNVPEPQDLLGLLWASECFVSVGWLHIVDCNLQDFKNRVFVHLPALRPRSGEVLRKTDH